VFHVSTASGEIGGGGDAWTAGAADDNSNPTTVAANAPARTIEVLVVKAVLRISSSSRLATAPPRMNAREVAARTSLFPNRKRMRASGFSGYAVGTLSRSLDGGAEVRLRHR
jgi:hypothetical protein